MRFSYIFLFIRWIVLLSSIYLNFISSSLKKEMRLWIIIQFELCCWKMLVGVWNDVKNLCSSNWSITLWNKNIIFHLITIMNSHLPCVSLSTSRIYKVKGGRTIVDPIYILYIFHFIQKNTKSERNGNGKQEFHSHTHNTFCFFNCWKEWRWWLWRK